MAKLPAQGEIVDCRRCPRLVEYREDVARKKVRRFADSHYWGRPVPSFGPAGGRLLVIGLAPAAHGGNRTGRIFTGDRSGDWLFESLYRAGFANQPTSEHRDDGLRLRGAYITAVVHCAPPGNKPTPQERDNCLPYLERELRLLPWRVIVALGSFAYDGVCRALGVRRRPAFGHGVEAPLKDGRTIICSYHPSQQNTQTGRLTREMLDAVFARAREVSTDASPPVN